MYKQEQQDHLLTKRNYEESKREAKYYKTLYKQEYEDHRLTTQNYEVLLTEQYNVCELLQVQLKESKSEAISYETLYDQEHEELKLTIQDNNRLAMEQEQIEETAASRYANTWKITHNEITTTSRELGRGGWGFITVGFFREQKVAVKQLYNNIMSESSLAVMHREIDTMSRLRHPNLLLFIGAALDHPSGNPLVITEIMDTSLRQAYEKNQIEEKTTKLSILRDTAAGLNYLHCHPDEIIHRDVSSANVLLESRGPNKWRAKLSDLGSANTTRNAFTEAAGAAVYSAPESIVVIGATTRPEQTTKMDVFSYGVLMCEVMTCRFPEVDKFQAMLQLVTDRSPLIGNIIRLCVKHEPIQQRLTMKQVINGIDSYMRQL